MISNDCPGFVFVWPEVVALVEDQGLFVVGRLLFVVAAFVAVVADFFATGHLACSAAVFFYPLFPGFLN